MSVPESVDVLVIGAGPAGSSSAALLHRAGLSVVVVEREVFPRFVIGESLLPHCMDLLDEAGLLPAVTAQGFIVKNGALFLRDGERCSFDFSEQFTPGWGWTWQVPRADFDQTLATATAAMGVPVCFQHEVVSVTMPTDPGYDPAVAGEDRPSVQVKGPDGVVRTVRARFVLDASGYGRVLPRALGLDVPSGQPFRRAVFAHVTGDQRPADPAEAGRIWVCLHPEGAWIWIIPFSNGRTSVGVVAPESFWEGRFDADDLEGTLRSALQSDPNAGERLSKMQLAWPKPRVLQGYSSTVSRVYGPGFALVGNATEFLDPVFSSGVTLALASANRASKALIRAIGGEAVDWEAAYAEPMRHGVDVFRTYVNGWYDGSLPTLFFAPDQNPEFKRQICSVLAGYVWDEENPFVRHHHRRLGQVVRRVTESVTP